VTEAVAREVVVAHLDDQPRGERLPLARALGAPAAGPARRAAGETGIPFQRDHDVGDLLAIRNRETRREANMVEQSFVVVEPQ
jgi:hypothetical protein